MGNLLAAVIGLPFFLKEELPEINGILMLVALGTFQLGISYVLYAKAIQSVQDILQSIISTEADSTPALTKASIKIPLSKYSCSSMFWFVEGVFSNFV